MAEDISPDLPSHIKRNSHFSFLPESLAIGLRIHPTGGLVAAERFRRRDAACANRENNIVLAR
jgi:hypothetical protein